MKTARNNSAVSTETTNFNYYKLQAVACIGSSAAVSIGLMYLAIRWFS